MAAETATDAIYRALRSPEPDPDLVHAAVEEIRSLRGQNVIAVIGAQIAELKAELKFETAELRAEMKAGFAEVNVRIDAQTARIDVMQRVIWRVIWPLIVLLAAPVFGLLYKALNRLGGASLHTSSPRRSPGSDSQWIRLLSRSGPMLVGG